MLFLGAVTNYNYFIEVYIIFRQNNIQEGSALLLKIQFCLFVTDHAYLYDFRHIGQQRDGEYPVDIGNYAIGCSFLDNGCPDKGFAGTICDFTVYSALCK